MRRLPAGKEAAGWQSGAGTHETRGARREDEPMSQDICERLDCASNQTVNVRDLIAGGRPPGTLQARLHMRGRPLNPNATAHLGMAMHSRRRPRHRRDVAPG